MCLYKDLPKAFQSPAGGGPPLAHAGEVRGQNAPTDARFPQAHEGYRRGGRVPLREPGPGMKCARVHFMTRVIGTGTPWDRIRDITNLAGHLPSAEAQGCQSTEARQWRR